MIKSIIISTFLILSTFLYASSEYDREIMVLNKTRDEKVAKVFKEMMETYDDEDVNAFFEYVSEDRFIQDYMLFYDAIELDMRVYDTLSIDNWIDKITEDGVKRFLYVRWEKRYLSTLGNDEDREIIQRGYSRFLFDEVNGKYKLIELAGNNFWGKSSSEWREEVPKIAGQEEIYQSAGQEDVYQSPGQENNDGPLPDLIIEEAACTDPTTYVILKNQGLTDVTSTFRVRNNTTGASNDYTTGVMAGDTANIPIGGGCTPGDEIEVDSENDIVESNENNNLSYSIDGVT